MPLKTTLVKILEFPSSINDRIMKVYNSNVDIMYLYSLFTPLHSGDGETIKTF